MVNSICIQGRYLFIVTLFLLSNQTFCQNKNTSDPGDIPEFHKQLNKIVIDGGYYRGKVSGPKMGEKVKDFTLSRSKNATFNLYNALKTKPVLLISGSYTCPIFRKCVNDINKISVLYKEVIDIKVVYIIEAHPDNEKSIFFEVFKAHKGNAQAKILYDQPTTFGERVKLAHIAKKKLRIDPVIIVDNATNDFFNYYGSSPTSTYIIDQNRKVAFKMMVSKPELLSKTVSEWVEKNLL